MKVSIITPTHNAEHFIAETIRSVLSQNIPDWEMLIIDDCSTDNTTRIVEGFARRDKRIKLIPLSINCGAAVARNKGLDVAIGEYVAFLDADDVWLPDKLGKQLRFMQDGRILLSYTAYSIVRETGEATGTVVDLAGLESVSYLDMLKKRATMGCSTVMMHRDSFSDFRMPLIRTGQDYGLWLRILKSGHKAFCLQEILTHYRVVPGSISRNKFKKALRQWQIYRQLERCSVPQSAWFFMHYAYRAVTR